MQQKDLPITQESNNLKNISQITNNQVEENENTALLIKKSLSISKPNITEQKFKKQKRRTRDDQQTNRKKCRSALKEDIYFHKNEKLFWFKMYKDVQIGFAEIMKEIVPSKIDQDCETTYHLLELGKKICLKDLQQALNLQQKIQKMSRQSLSFDQDTREEFSEKQLSQKIFENQQ